MHSGKVKIATHKKQDKCSYSSYAQHKTKAANHLIDIIKQDKTETQYDNQQLETFFDINTTSHHHAAAGKIKAPAT